VVFAFLAVDLDLLCSMHVGGFPGALAFNNTGALFANVSGSPLPPYSGYIAEITPDGTQTRFVQGTGNSLGLAFQPVPEPAGVGLVAIGVITFLTWRRQILRQTF